MELEVVISEGLNKIRQEKQLLKKSCQWVSLCMGKPVGFLLSFKNQVVPDFAATTCLVCLPAMLITF